MNLFEQEPEAGSGLGAPLAERMRPRTLEEFAGQDHLLGKGKPLRQLIERDQVPSMILWGPPGTGKTSLAKLIARRTKAQFVPFSAVTGGIKEAKEVMAAAGAARRYGTRTILFVDEIHRFNRAQQDAFLPYVEKGEIVLIGATTENPAFEVNGALLSRARVYRLEGLDPKIVADMLRKALEREYPGLAVEAGVVEEIARRSAGDARAAYGMLEAAASGGALTMAALEDVVGSPVARYDKAGEEHYNLASALQKSVRSSDPDAALYWLARMLEGGEDRMFVARRLMVMAVEDVGLADPRAVEQAAACQRAVEFLGIPEGDIALGQLTVYLAVAPKSNASYRALGEVREIIRRGGVYEVPHRLRNAATAPMKEWGYGVGYESAHEDAEGVVGMECLPDGLAGRVFYIPLERGLEVRIGERLAAIRAKREERRDREK
jgi:putative ATPase